MRERDARLRRRARRLRLDLSEARSFQRRDLSRVESQGAAEPEAAARALRAAQPLARRLHAVHARRPPDPRLRRFSARRIGPRPPDRRCRHAGRSGLRRGHRIRASQRCGRRRMDRCLVAHRTLLPARRLSRGASTADHRAVLLVADRAADVPPAGPRPGARRGIEGRAAPHGPADEGRMLIPRGVLAPGLPAARRAALPEGPWRTSPSRRCLPPADVRGPRSRPGGPT